MTIYEFNKLDVENRLLSIRDQGQYLGKTIHNSEACSIYAIEKFFVECIFEDETYSELHALRSFTCGPQLDKYSLGINESL